MICTSGNIPLPPSKGEFAPFFCHSTTEEWTDRLPLRAEAIAQAG